MHRPASTEYAPYYEKYIQLAGEGDLQTILKTQLDESLKFLRSIPESQGDTVHKPYAWTIKQAIGHVVDGERIFAYRLLRIARGDGTPLPGFDENAYAKTGRYEQLTVADLAEEFESVRRATLTLIANLPESSWASVGTANGFAISARALAWVIVGHANHHFEILRKRLGQAAASNPVPAGA